MVIFAIIGIVAVFAVGFWAFSVKFPKVGNKISEFVEKIISSFKRKDSQTVEELGKLDN